MEKVIPTDWEVRSAFLEKTLSARTHIHRRMTSQPEPWLDPSYL